MHWVWPSKCKEKWPFSPKCVFSEMDHHTALNLVPLWLPCLKTPECTEFGPLNTEGNDVLAHMCFFLRNGSSYSVETCTIAISMPENLSVCWVWPSKYKGKWHFSPKCVFFSERDHHIALHLVPLQLACLKTSGCTEFGPLNIKESDVLAQNVLFCCFIIYSLIHLLTRPMGSSPLDLIFLFYSCPISPFFINNSMEFWLLFVIYHWNVLLGN